MATESSVGAPKFDPKNMQYRFLGKTGLKVSALSFGSWVTGMTPPLCSWKKNARRLS
jgi:hypothetical protein